jgi:hypothetical protein
MRETGLRGASTRAPNTVQWCSTCCSNSVLLQTCRIPPRSFSLYVCRRFGPGGSLDRLVNFVAACPCADGLVRDGTQGKNEPCIILHQGARSRGYKRCERARAGERVGESEREREGLALPVFSRPFVVRIPALSSSFFLPLVGPWTPLFIDTRRL